MFRYLRILFWVLLTSVLLNNPVAAQETVGLTVFRDEDSLTLYVPGNQNISLLNLGFDVDINNNRYIKLLQDYEAFRTLYFADIPTPICFRLERQGTQKPVPQACQGILLLIQPLADADVFWYDQMTKQERTFLIVSAPSTVGICPAGQTQCTVSYDSSHEFTPTRESMPLMPTSEPTQISEAPTSLSPPKAMNPITAGSSNGDWQPVNEQFRGVPVVFVPSGCFLMGNMGGEEDETPVHEVCLSAFWIGQTEVTNAQYRICVDAGSCPPPSDQTFYSNPAYSDHPVVNVSWDSATTYARWLGGRLPTEAEWEYAARGPQGWLFPWGNHFDSARLNYCDENCPLPWRDWQHNDFNAQSAPVASYPSGQSWVGAFDMAGNVFEWVFDWYHPGYYNMLEEGTWDPMGPNSGNKKVMRGCSWGCDESHSRTTYRDYKEGDELSNGSSRCGFRVVISGN